MRQTHSRPHILILMPDQQRADCMGCAGHSLINTPNMDCLAAEGTRFWQACTVSPLCMPARASFVSGLYPHNHSMWHNAGHLPADDETFFHHLQRAAHGVGQAVSLSYRRRRPAHVPAGVGSAPHPTLSPRERVG